MHPVALHVCLVIRTPRFFSFGGVIPLWHRCAQFPSRLSRCTSTPLTSTAADTRCTCYALHRGYPERQKIMSAHVEGQFVDVYFTPQYLGGGMVVAQKVPVIVWRPRRILVGAGRVR